MAALAAPAFRDTLVDLDDLIAGRLISEREHPSAPLRILNYTKSAQFEGVWHETVRTCRGLILDADGRLVARPFRKFFNLGERGATAPDGPFEVWEKYDGSLGVLYWVDGRPAIASRGSFLSDQALAGTSMLEDLYRDTWGRLDPGETYLFEIIYPENRIVVDYGARRELRLLSIVDTASGAERHPDPSIGFPIAEMVGEGRIGDDPSEWLARVADNREGFVLFWRDLGERLKVKGDEYRRLHRLVTGFTLKHIWESLRDGAELMSVAEQATPEMRAWLEGQVATLGAAYDAVEAACRAAMAGVPDGGRKEQAEYIKGQRYPHILFGMLDGKDWQGGIWKLVRPERGFETFRKDDA